MSVGTEFELFSTICVKKQSYCVCHLVNNKVKNYTEYVKNKGRTMLFCNGIGLSLRVFERIRLLKARIEKVFKVVNISKNQLRYNGTRDGP